MGSPVMFARPNSVLPGSGETAYLTIAFRVSPAARGSFRNLAHTFVNSDNANQRNHVNSVKAQKTLHLSRVCEWQKQTRQTWKIEPEKARTLSNVRRGIIRQDFKNSNDDPNPIYGKNRHFYCPRNLSTRVLGENFDENPSVRCRI